MVGSLHSATLCVNTNVCIRFFFPLLALCHTVCKSQCVSLVNILLVLNHSW